MTQVIAHRGYSAKYPENTLLAFEKALEAGADGVEFDVHLTKDKQLVVHHNYYLSAISKDDEEMSELTYERLRDREVPILAEVLKQFGSTTRCEVELKGYTEEFVEKVATIVSEHNILDRIEFTSPHLYVLTEIKRYLPKAKTGMFTSPVPGWMNKKLWQEITLNNALLGQISVIHSPVAMLNEDFIKDVHKAGLIVHAADCNNEQDLKKAFELRVDQLSTNEVELAVKNRRILQAN